MIINNNKLIINQKRSESINFVIDLDSEELRFTDYNEIKSDVKNINNIKGNVLINPVINVTASSLTYYISSKDAEKLPNKVFFDIKGIIGEDVEVIMEGEIYISENTTKIF